MVFIGKNRLVVGALAIIFVWWAYKLLTQAYRGIFQKKCLHLVHIGGGLRFSTSRPPHTGKQAVIFGIFFTIIGIFCLIAVMFIIIFLYI
ncbi:hypothetical protein DRH14_02345 [Candidatus Shapirobacteria bacterium]|nr:MAG: hypothetical protein DRH14_02345 [Candidatus Shapirobacteria bacterium]